jgi:hypothetical protein
VAATLLTSNVGKPPLRGPAGCGAKLQALSDGCNSGEQPDGADLRPAGGHCTRCDLRRPSLYVPSPGTFSSRHYSKRVVLCAVVNPTATVLERREITFGQYATRTSKSEVSNR